MVSTCLTMQQGTCRVSCTQFKTSQPSARSFIRGITPHSRSIKRTSVYATSRQEKTSDSAASPTPTPPAPTAADVIKVSRRAFQGEALLLALLGTSLQAGEAQAIGFKKELKKKKIPIEEYSELANGLKYYDLSTGSGKVIAPGTNVTVHYDCIFRGIDVVSSRSARLLGGNRTIAEPFQFIAGEPVSTKSVKSVGDSAGGLFSGMSGPKAPPALSTAVVGMKVGGIRSVIVPPELGFGDIGEQEIGPGQTFEMKIEVLDVA